MTTDPRYFAFGNVAIDDLVFADGTTMWAVPGGGAVYAALGMALWTARATPVAPLGNDYPRERFAALDFSQCRSVAHTMRNWGLYETDGTRHFLSRRDSLPWSAFSTDAAELHAGPYPACHIAPMPFARVTALVDALVARGARVLSLDLHDRELAGVDILQLIALIERVQIFLPSRQDAQVLYPDRTPLEALRALRAKLPRVSVIGVKCGADGALVHGAGDAEILAVPAALADVVDATGAGDAFCGGFLTGYAQGGGIATAAVRGAVSASYALSAVGPSALTTADPSAARARADALRHRLARIAIAP